MLVKGDIVYCKSELERFTVGQPYRVLDTSAMSNVVIVSNNETDSYSKWGTAFYQVTVDESYKALQIENIDLYFETKAEKRVRIINDL